MDNRVSMGRTIVTGLVQVAKWVVPPLIRAAGYALNAMAKTTAALIHGMPEAIENLSQYWLDEYHKSGGPSDYDQFVKFGAAVMAVMVFVFGWVLLSLVTVWVLGMIF